MSLFASMSESISAAIIASVTTFILRRSFRIALTTVSFRSSDMGVAQIALLIGVEGTSFFKMARMGFLAGSSEARLGTDWDSDRGVTGESTGSVVSARTAETMVPKRNSGSGVVAIAADEVVPDARATDLRVLLARAFSGSLDEAGLPETSGDLKVTPVTDLALLRSLEGVTTGFKLDFLADD